MTHAISPLHTPATGRIDRSPLSVVGEPAIDAPATISASEMSRLTGVERERLRTWERRHGFPVPVRCANNVRRYRAEDVRRVSAIASASAQGVPLAKAIAAIAAAPAPATPSIAPGMALSNLPSPAIVVSGPRPLEVIWRNGAAEASAAAPLIGDDLGADPACFGPTAVEALRRLMAGEVTGAQTFEARDWTTAAALTCQVTAWLLDVPGGVPTAVIAQLPQEQASMAVPSAHAPVGAPATRWAEATAAGRDVLRRDRGLASLQRALAATSQAIGASDAVVALCQGGTLRVARSVRGHVAPLTAPLDAVEELRDAVESGAVTWLGLRAAATLRLDPRTRGLAVPIAVADQVVGVVLFLVREETQLCAVTQEVLLGFGSALGATLERERSLRAASAA